MQTQRMKKVLDFLGAPYQIKTIDGEDCVYRDIGSGFDIEVSGVNHPRRGTVCTYICVWHVWPIQDSNTTRIVGNSVEYVWYPKTLTELKRVLDGLTVKYGAGSPSLRQPEPDVWIQRMSQKPHDIVDPDFSRLSRLSDIWLSMSQKLRTALRFEDDPEGRRLQRKMFAQLVVVRKLHARELDGICRNYERQQQQIERALRTTSNDVSLRKLYKSIVGVVRVLEMIRLQNGRWLIETAEAIRSLGVNFSDVELRTMLSVSESEWRNRRNKECANIAELMLVNQIGDLSLGQMLVEAVEDLYPVAG